MMPLILLHGALGAADQLSTLRKAFEDSGPVLCPDFSGHGAAAAGFDSYAIPLFAQDVLALMDEAGVEQADVFGYSMGGYVGLYIAQHFPQRIRRVAALGTKYFWTAEYAAEQIRLLDPEKIFSKLPRFAEALAKRHTANDWRDVLHKTASMMTELGSAEKLPLSEPASVTHPALLMVGDRDNTVSIGETEQMCRLLQAGQLAVLPATSHPFEKVSLPLLTLLLKNFFA